MHIYQIYQSVNTYRNVYTSLSVVDVYDLVELLKVHDDDVDELYVLDEVLLHENVYHNVYVFIAFFALVVVLDDLLDEYVAFLDVFYQNWKHA